MDAPRAFRNQRVAFRPVSAIDRIKAHPTIADMNLKPIAMLQLMCPSRPSWGLLGDDWLTRMEAGAFMGLPRESRTPQHAAIIGLKKKGCHRDMYE